jgi:hypothetical protein
MAALARSMKPGPAFDLARDDPELEERRRIGRTPGTRAPGAEQARPEAP